MRVVDIIAKKRDGKALNQEEIEFFISRYAGGEVPDYQASAWCMAVYFKGMTPEETAALTRAMIASGKVFDLSGIQGPLVDKHSTGGVGDKISLILAPLAAACGVTVPMMSGRALGHTGGTLDKLDSIPGYSTHLSEDQFRSALEAIGFAMTGQSQEVVPADRKMYALRDVTATVESIPLITASILSKKFAEGAQSLVMDIKCGSGGFMKTKPQAQALARSLVNTGKSLDRKVIALITDMDEPLGRMVGNFLEVRESVECLQGRGPEDVREITLRLTASMLKVGGLAATEEEGVKRCREALADGSALEKFYENTAFQGGDVPGLKKMLTQAKAPFSQDFPAPRGGYIQTIHALAVGQAGLELGVGRSTITDPVAKLAGIELLKKRGEAVQAGEPVMRLWAEDEDRLLPALNRLKDAVILGDSPPPPRKSLILEEIRN